MVYLIQCTWFPWTEPSLAAQKYSKCHRVGIFHSEKKIVVLHSDLRNWLDIAKNSLEFPFECQQACLVQLMFCTYMCILARAYKNKNWKKHKLVWVYRAGDWARDSRLPGQEHYYWCCHQCAAQKLYQQCTIKLTLEWLRPQSGCMLFRIVWRWSWAHQWLLVGNPAWDSQLITFNYVH